ncbi:MAG TPA: ABC transporter ATP-binding protein [Acidimicrobiales bacterium]|nr:ABC transporter ATP-binding protein [Acidimicrobiales bacterium]|tara:strand:+ start:3628 stop:4365 length:738 start_codon:yes stop_codon:yes gene_type:complete
MNTSSNAAARVVNGTKIYGEGETEVKALDEVNVEFQAGEFTAIMGPSGSGKSTLMHCVAGLDILTTGQSFINDVSLNELSDKDLTLLRRDKIGFVFQAFNLIPTLNAKENLTLPMDLAGQKVDPIWLNQVITSVGLGDRLDHRPDQLSGGQQQRVAVARALVSQPAIVFADEPTGNLDSITGNEVLEFLRSAVDDLNQTLVMVTHDAAAASRADRVLFLADGKIVEELSAPSSEEIFDTLKRLDG